MIEILAFVGLAIIAFRLDDTRIGEIVAKIIFLICLAWLLMSPAIIERSL